MNLSTSAAATGLNAITALFNGGTLIFYSGTMAASPETATVGANVALATFTFSATAFGAPSFVSGFQQAQASFVNNTVTPSANGTVTWARALKSDGTTVIQDYSVASSGADITIANTALQTTIQVQISSLYEKLPGV